MSTTGFTFPHITGVDWRLDYFIKSNSVEKINSPMYLISLETKTELELDQEKGIANVHLLKKETTEQVEFSCSADQLQDLLARLKDAAKQVERSATTL